MRNVYTSRKKSSSVVRLNYPISTSENTRTVKMGIHNNLVTIYL